VIRPYGRAFLRGSFGQLGLCVFGLRLSALELHLNGIRRTRFSLHGGTLGGQQSVDIPKRVQLVFSLVCAHQITPFLAFL
jgi:hypothetical protein